MAERIAFERRKHGLSYEGLAKAMTEAGCSIAGSAIYRIEKGNPPRRVTVDELVALAAVLGADIPDLLRPMGEVERMRAQQIIGLVGDATDGLLEAGRTAFTLLAELSSIFSDDEMREYAKAHHRAAHGDDRVRYGFTAEQVGWGVTDDQAHLANQVLIDAANDLSLVVAGTSRALQVVRRKHPSA